MLKMKKPVKANQKYQTFDGHANRRPVEKTTKAAQKQQLRRLVDYINDDHDEDENDD